VANILVIETDPWLRSKLTQLLTSVGHKVCSVASGSMGLDKLTKYRAEAVVLDMLVPDVTGITLIQELKKSGLDKESIVAITDQGVWLSADFVLDMARGFGVKQTLVKPFSEKDFLHCVTTALSPHVLV
jgi:DNA-binding response OmpR family regulator